MVGVLDFGSNSQGWRLGWGHFVLTLVKHFALTVPLFTQVYKWVSASLMLVGAPVMD